MSEQDYNAFSGELNINNRLLILPSLLINSEECIQKVYLQIKNKRRGKFIESPNICIDSSDNYYFTQ